MEESVKEYYNVYIESYPTDKNTSSRSFTLLACVEADINSYIRHVKANILGRVKLTHQTIEVVVPKTFVVYDFSNTGINRITAKRVEFFNHVNDNNKPHGKEKEYFASLGEDVTSKLGIDIDDFTRKKIKLKKFSKEIIDNSVEPAFEVKEVAGVFASHIRNLKDESGQMVGIFGQWGRGKTYFINQVFKEFGSESPSPFIWVKFQAWKYQNTPSIWAYLFETVLDKYLDVVFYKKIWRVIKLSLSLQVNLKSLIVSVLLIFMGFISLSFTPKLTEIESLQTTIRIFSILGILTISANGLITIFEKVKKPALNIFNSISKIPSFKNVLGVQAEIQKELKNLIKVWSRSMKNQRILLFIDDLDRCSEYQIVEIIDSLRVMLDDELITKNLLILVALDEEKLKKAINSKYDKLFEKKDLPNVIDEYMDKLFISAIKLFPISFDERSEFINKLISQINDNTKKKEVESKEDNSSQLKKNKPGMVALSSEEHPPEIVLTSQKTLTDENIVNINTTEVGHLNEKIKASKNELTPRQIRILIYRYLLSRNLWLTFIKETDFDSQDMITEIMRFSHYIEVDNKVVDKMDPRLSKIARMVVAY